MDAVTSTPAPINEPVLDYAPGSAERAALEVALAELGNAKPTELTHVIGGKRVQGKGKAAKVVQPHAHRKVLGVTLRDGTKAEAGAAIDAAMAAAPAWRDLSFDDRAAILLKAAELLAGPWRSGSTPRPCWGRARRHTRPRSTRRASSSTSGGSTCTSPSRSSPSSRSPTAPASGTAPTTARSRGSSTPSRPSTSRRSPATCRPRRRSWATRWCGSRRHTQQLAASLTMELLEEAGMPPGVINMVTGHGARVSEVALRHSEFAGLHFTGSTPSSSGCGADRGEPAGYRSLPADRGRDRRQGLHPRPPQRRPGRAAHGDDPWRVRVPRVRSARPPHGPTCRGRCGRSSRTTSSTITDGLSMGDGHRPVQLHGCGHRRPGLRQAQGGHRPGARDRGPRGRRRRHLRRLRGLVRAADHRRVHDPTDEMFTDRVLRSDPLGPRLRGRAVRAR
jgi:hypothetical protein